jgi:ABC-type multidrug transport system ATPase subunit
MIVQGDIRVNGYLSDTVSMRQRSGYMYQDEVFIGSMTVAEHLWFMVSLE